MKIRFEQVTKTYQEAEKPVLFKFDLSIQKGEFVLLTGESGIGKTTLLRLLLREIYPQEGKITVGEYNLGTLSESELPFYRRKLGVIFQDFRLVETKNVYENIYLAREVIGGRKKDSRRAVTAICSFLGIADLYKRYPEELSGGQKQKVCLARALVNYPDLILADEPTGNLSYEESVEIMKLFALIHQQGVTIVMATHDKDSLKDLSYREIILGEREGKE